MVIRVNALPLDGSTAEPIRARVWPTLVYDPARDANKRFHLLVLSMIDCHSATELTLERTLWRKL